MPPRNANSRNPNHPEHYGVILRTLEESAKWSTLAQRTIRPTRYLDRRALARMKMHDDVIQALRRAGVLGLVSTQFPTFRGLVLEFLTTIEKIGRRQMTGIKFRMRNREYTLTNAELDAYLQLANDPEPANLTYRNGQFWWTLTETAPPPPDAVWPSSNAKASRIRNPILRALQVLFRNCIFARRDAGAINAPEMRLLWAALTGIKTELAKELYKYLWRVGNGEGGDILCGGLVSLLALVAGADVSELRNIPGPTAHH